MATSTTKTNKPLNPRGNDQSPLAFNRAKLYSGKALDFDGVNDYVDCGTLDVTAYTGISISLNLKLANTSDILRFVSLQHTGIDDLRIVQNGATIFFTLDDGTTYDVETPTLTANEWNKLDMTFDGTTLKGYLNGVLIGSLAASFDFSTAIGLLTLFKHSAASQYAEGSMSGFKIFNTALTSAQVADLYNNPEKVVPTGVDNTALKLWLPMMEGAGTKCLDGASLHTATERVENGDFSDGTTGWVGNPDTTLVVTNGQLDIQSASGAGEYGAAFSEVNFTSGKYYLIQLDVISCNVPTQIRIGGTGSAVNYATNIWNSGEIGIGSHSILWLAPSNYTYLAIGGRDDVTTLVIDNVSVKEVSVGDISGATWTHGVGSPVAQTSVIDWNKRILDKTNEFLIPQGLTAGRDLLGNLFENVRKQGALNLDGNSWAEVHDNGSLDITDAITLEAWVYNIQDGTTAKGIMGQWYGAVGGAKNSLLYKSDDDDFQFYVNISGVSYNLTTGDSVTSGWHHIVGTYDGSNMKIYVDGAESATTARTGTLDTSTGAFEIGRYFGLLSNITNTPIAQPRIYNRALTAEEVQRSYDSGKNIYTNS